MCTFCTNSTIFFFYFLATLTHKVDPNSNFNRIWKEIVDETLKDNTEEEIMRYLCEVQQQVENSSRPRHRICHINRDREGGHSGLLNDYSKNSVYIERLFR